MSNNLTYDKALEEFKLSLIRQKAHEPLSDWEWTLAKAGFDLGWFACSNAILEAMKK